MKKTPLSIPALAILIICITLTITSAWADDLKVFSNGSVADANDVNGNFTELETRIETISLTPGETGAVGAQGIQGSTGSDGANGANGTNGSDGATGAQGAAGVDGAPGSKGDIGETGDKGDIGAAGADGTMYDGAAPGDMQYWNGNAWLMITAPEANADSLSFCDGLPTWTTGGCPVFYEVGDVGPAGGIVFYITDGGLHGLEMAPEDQGSYVNWGCYNEIVADQDSFGISVGDGQANTNLILAHTCSGPKVTGPETMDAAIIASNYTLGDKGGWFLPSEGELELMALVFDLTDNVGRLDGWYWSSSQIDSDYVSMFETDYNRQWGQGTSRADKGNSLKVRSAKVF
jgi:hypothetical protein